MLCYVGKYLSDIFFSKEMFKYAIVTRKPLYELPGIKVYYPTDESFEKYTSTVITELYRKGVFFFFRNPQLIAFLEIEPQIFETFLCTNQYKYKWLESKNASRLWISKYVDTLPVCIITKVECTKPIIISRYKGFSEFVIQNEFSSGGNGTMLLNDDNWMEIENLSSTSSYTISPYYRQMKSFNIHLFISNDFFVIAPMTEQNIELKKNHLIYSGCTYTKDEIPIVILSNLKIIAQKLSMIGYTGYCGIDFLSDGSNFIFVEFNNRMQGSSALVDKVLQYNYNISIYNLAISTSINTLSSLQINTRKLSSAIYLTTPLNDSIQLNEADIIRCWKFQEEV